MKKLLSLLASSLIVFALCAQTNTSPFKKFYVDFGGGGSSHNGAFAGFAAKGILKNNWMGSVSYYTMTSDPSNLPSNYEPGYTVIVIFPIPDPMPSVEMKLINLTAGRFFPMGRKTWFTTEAGLSVVSGKKYVFSPQKTDGNWGWGYIPSNYMAEQKSQTTIGAMLRTDITWAFSNFAGMSFGAFANANSIQSQVGAEIKLIVGWMNTRKRNS